MCRAYVFPDAPLNDAALLRDGVRFGKGLQLVNILRDYHATCGKAVVTCQQSDWRASNSRPWICWIPKPRRAFVRFTTSCSISREAHLAAGWAYTNSLPRFSDARTPRVRVANSHRREDARAFAPGNPLDAERRVKVGRPAVKQIIIGHSGWRLSHSHRRGNGCFNRPRV